MTKFELGGYEGPIPNIALPDPQLSADMPIQSLVLPDGTNFEKADWVALGYTHYEVWCVGAAGSLGAEAGEGYVPARTTITFETYPDYIWAAMKAGYVQDYTSEGSYYISYVDPKDNWNPPEPGAPYGTLKVKTVTWGEWFEMQNPTHRMQVSYHHDPFVTSATSPSVGGGGGGGGLHVVSGHLSDLPDSVPVTVGIAGVDPIPGQIRSPNPFDLFAEPVNFLAEGYDAHPSMYNYQRWSYDLTVLQNRYPPIEERTLLLPPQPGEDGGYSAFGDIAMASGGKGGGPALVWVDGHRFFAAHGGEGGTGGRIEAGGGALGSTSNLPGKDGTWNGEIGTGGGGGRGGMAEVKYETFPQMGIYR